MTVDKSGRPVGVRLVVGLDQVDELDDAVQTIDSVERHGQLGPADELLILTVRGDRRAARLARDHVGGSVRLQRVHDLTSAAVVDRAVATTPGGHPGPAFVAFLSAGDQLQTGSLARIRDLVAAEPTVDLIHGDFTEQTSTSTTRASTTVCTRPVWSPDRLRTRYDLGPLLVMRTSLLEGLDPASPHDLALLIGERAGKVAHLPHVLVDRASGRRDVTDPEAVQRHLDRRQLAMRVEPEQSGADGVRLEPRDPVSPAGRRASIIVLTGGATREVAGRTVLLVANALASVLVGTASDDYEIVVVLDRNAPDELGEQLRGLAPERVVVVRDRDPFNFSAANNLGVAAASGDVFVFLNDDAEVRTGDWLDRIVMHLGVPGVGVVGARLLYGDGRIQHAGLVARGGYVEHRFAGYADDDSTRSAPVENVSAVTGACLAITRSTFETLGGFPEVFPLNFNDVELCFAAQERGLRVVLDNDLVLVHHETSSRDPGITDDEQALFVERWPDRASSDPYANPNDMAVRGEPIAPPAALLRLRATLGVDGGPVRIVPAGL